MMRTAVFLLTVLLMSACTSMLLGSGSSNAGSYPSASDASISERVRAQFAADATIAAFDLNVRTYSGSVVLSGTVDRYVVREQAGKLAKATTGVRAVTNQIVVDD